MAGREDDIESFEVLVDRAEVGRPARSVVFTGLSGVGKTVLLQDLAGRAEQRGWITARVEADRGSGPTSFTDGLSRSLATSLRREQGRGKTKERLRAALRTVTSFSMSFNPDGAVSLGFDVDAAKGRADSGSLYADLTDLALDLGDVAVELGVGVAVFIDEMQDLTPEELSAVCRACHETGQRSSPWFVIGCGLPNLPGALAAAESYAERLFEYRLIDRLPELAAHAALVNPAKAEGVDWEPAAAAHVVAQSAGYPYFIQQFGQSTWNDAAASLVMLADAERGVNIGFEHLDMGFFRARWDRATPSERRYLSAMAIDGDGPSASGEVARRIGKKPTSLGPTRANLINKGILYAPSTGRSLSPSLACRSSSSGDSLSSDEPIVDVRGRLTSVAIEGFDTFYNETAEAASGFEDPLDVTDAARLCWAMVRVSCSWRRRAARSRRVGPEWGHGRPLPPLSIRRRVRRPRNCRRRSCTGADPMTFSRVSARRG